MRISDWSSDVCSSDLAWNDALPVGAVDVAVRERPRHVAIAADHHGGQAGPGEALHVDLAARRAQVRVAQARAEPRARRAPAERKSVVEGKSVAVRVDLGVRRYNTTHTKNNTECQ